MEDQKAEAATETQAEAATPTVAAEETEPVTDTAEVPPEDDLELTDEDIATLHDPILQTIKGETDEQMSDAEIKIAIDRGIVTEEEVVEAKKEAEKNTKTKESTPDTKKTTSKRAKGSDRQNQVKKVIEVLKAAGDEGMTAFGIAKALGDVAGDAEPSSETVKEVLKGIRSLARDAVDSSGGQRTKTEGRNKIYVIPGTTQVAPTKDETASESDTAEEDAPAGESQPESKEKSAPAEDA